MLHEAKGFVIAKLKASRRGITITFDVIFKGLARFYGEGTSRKAYGLQAEISGDEATGRLSLTASAPDETLLIGFYHGILDTLEQKIRLKEHLVPPAFQNPGGAGAGGGP